ncbi:MAG: FmdB family zinc ribbon protein [Burkholderiaceae bacterium]
MPIYAYRCDDCGFEKDVLQKLSDAPLTECPSCGKPAFKKQVTAAGFQLKGSGWYVTDFRGGNKTKEAPAKDAATKDASKDAGSAAKPDSASAPASTPAPAASTPAASDK